jgi:riboflavin biosynthesis pyrimidine reductase
VSALPPLQDLFDATTGDDVALPCALSSLYGRLRLPRHPARPHVIGNFVASLDGVVSLGIPGKAGGGEISGFNLHDRMVMGLLRAAADAVVIGAGTLRASSPEHVWTAEYIYPPLADAYRDLRTALGKPEPPLNVVVTASGEIDLDRRLFCSGEVKSLIVTTADGARRLCDRELSSSVQVVAAANTAPLSARVVLDVVGRVQGSDVVLLEAGPRLMGDFFAERLLDELFLTLAPQVAGRDEVLARPGLVAGKRFAPDDPLWGALVGLKRGGDHIFLRYAFASACGTTAESPGCGSRIVLGVAEDPGSKVHIDHLHHGAGR